MWDTDEEMQAFKALPYRDKLRVGRCLARGQAPADRHLAAAAVELAESYQRKSRGYLALLRWFPVFLMVIGGLGVALNATGGDPLGLVIYALYLPMGFAYLACSPVTRPKNMARALEASRLVSSAGIAPYLKDGAEYVEDIRRADAERLSQLEQ